VPRIYARYRDPPDEDNCRTVKRSFTRARYHTVQKALPTLHSKFCTTTFSRRHKLETPCVELYSLERERHGMPTDFRKTIEHYLSWSSIEVDAGASSRWRTYMGYGQFSRTRNEPSLIILDYSNVSGLDVPSTNKIFLVFFIFSNGGESNNDRDGDLLP
jgi:hypothetical protein